MKKKIIITTVIASTLFFSCNKDNQPVKISGKIENKNSNKLIISDSESGYKKEISVDESGNFKDTLHIKSGFFTLFDGAEYAALFIEKGDDIHITLNTKQFDETISFTGKGSEESNFLAKSALNQEAFFMDNSIFNEEKEIFTKKINQYVEDFNNRLASEKNLSTDFISLQNKSIEEFKGFAFGTYEQKQYLLTVLAKGEEAPKFNDYENFNGGTTSLDDLKGSYVYIDVWATWCQPCKQEIPYLEELEKQYHDKNIKFVSISLDDKRDYETWKEMVKEKNLGGIQLYANKDSKFSTAYRISSIPRFILIDPQGNIVNSQAPRPSEKDKINTLFNSLEI